MSTQSLAQTCINSYREVLRRNFDGFGFSLGHDVGLDDSPSKLAKSLKARLLSPSTIGVNFLAVAVMVLEAKAHA